MANDIKVHSVKILNLVSRDGNIRRCGTHDAEFCSALTGWGGSRFKPNSSATRVRVLFNLPATLPLT